MLVHFVDRIKGYVFCNEFIYWSCEKSHTNTVNYSKSPAGETFIKLINVEYEINAI